MRAFVAIPLSESVRSNLKRFCEGLGDVKGVKKVPPKNLHLTLDFLGEITEGETKIFARRMAEIAAKTKPFSLTVSGVGAFPRRNHPKTLWVGLEKSISLLRLASDVKDALESDDKKKFSPHLTVGRVKYEDDSQGIFLRRFFQAENLFFGTLNIDRFCLMKSDLSGKTPVYTILNEFMLKEGEHDGKKDR